MTIVNWQPFDIAGKAKQEDLLANTRVAALRKLAPDTGAYINEVRLATPTNASLICISKQLRLTMFTHRPIPMNPIFKRRSGETTIRVY